MVVGLSGVKIGLNYTSENEMGELHSGSLICYSHEYD